MKKVILVVVALALAVVSNAQTRERGTVDMEVNTNIIGVSPDSETAGDYAFLLLYVDAQVAAMYNITNMFAVGIGAGVGTHIFAVTGDGEFDSESFVTIPVMAKIKFTPGNGRVGFVGRMDGGIEFIPESEGESSFYVTHPQIGIRFNMFNLLVGYRSTYSNDHLLDVALNDSWSYATLGLGWTF